VFISVPALGKGTPAGASKYERLCLSAVIASRNVH
jgi:hypothetical protein